MSRIFSRRDFLSTGALAAGSVLLAGCDKIITSDATRSLLRVGERMTMGVQRAMMTDRTMAREFKRAQVSKYFPTTGTVFPAGDQYKRLLDSRFAQWRLDIGGLVLRPLSLTLNQLKDLPGRTQITQHQCDEGWTAIGEWTGVSMGHLLQMAGLLPTSRYVVIHCMDADSEGEYYYESLDLFDALHPQTILAYGMNGVDLPVAHGAPIRLRAEFHIGYKNAKYVQRLEVVDSLKAVGKGQGSINVDAGYQWYVGM